MKRSTERLALRLHGAVAVMLVAGALAATDCTSDHDALAARPRPNGGSGGKAGAGGTGAGRGGAGGGSSARGGTGGSGGTGGTKPVLPEGRSVATLVHAIVDAPSIAWCFAKDDGETTTLVGSPRPPGGTPYGGSLVLESVSGVDHDAEILVPFALTGDLGRLDGLDCEEAVAQAEEEMRSAAASGSAPGTGAGGEGGEAGAANGGAAGERPVPIPRLRVARLPSLAPGTLTSGYSVLYAAVGCIGGAAFSHPDEDEICGEGYAPGRTTLSAELVVVSRTVRADVVAFQALHASRAFGQLGVRLAPPDDAVEAPTGVGDPMTEGALRPREPRTDLQPGSYGIGSADWRVQAIIEGSPVISDLWPDVLERSQQPVPEMGRGYTLIVMGPSTDFGPGWWNPPAFALTDNDPEP